MCSVCIYPGSARTVVTICVFLSRHDQGTGVRGVDHLCMVMQNLLSERIDGERQDREYCSKGCDKGLESDTPKKHKSSQRPATCIVKVLQISELVSTLLEEGPFELTDAPADW